MAILTRILEKPFFRYVMLIYILVVFLSAVIIYIDRDKNISLSLSDRLEVRVEKELSQLQNDLNKSLQSVKSDVNEMKMNISADSEQYKELIKIMQDLDLNSLKNIFMAADQNQQFSTRVDIIENEIDGIKKTLNPSNPELLSVARLGDKFELILAKINSIENKLQTIEKETDEKLERNYDLAAAQVDRIVDMLKWVGLLLIPIIFTTIRELFVPRKVSGENQGS